MVSAFDSSSSSFPPVYLTMSITSSILVYGHDDTLLKTRRWVLEKAGYDVTTVSTTSSVMAALAGDSPDLIVLCHTLTAGERRAAIATATSLEPPVKTLCIVTSRLDSGENGLSGDVLDSMAGAQALIAAAQMGLG